MDENRREEKQKNKTLCMSQCIFWFIWINLGEINKDFVLIFFYCIEYRWNLRNALKSLVYENIKNLLYDKDITLRNLVKLMLISRWSLPLTWNTIILCSFSEVPMSVLGKIEVILYLKTQIPGFILERDQVRTWQCILLTFPVLFYLYWASDYIPEHNFSPLPTFYLLFYSLFFTCSTLTHSFKCQLTYPIMHRFLPNSAKQSWSLLGLGP